VRFHLLDALESLREDHATAHKVVSQSEEYLGDHFPTFPVLPGVLMLEAATQAAGWVVLHRAGLTADGFDAETYDGPTFIAIRAVRNIRYGHFVAPGRKLTVRADLTASDTSEAGDATGSFKIEGTVDTQPESRVAFTGKLELVATRLSSRGASDAAADVELARAHRSRFANLTRGKPIVF
jgi:3-hydroxyacyl-[acyl-carrier-protein] dehydratase